MGIPVLILGESGSGKSCSLRNFNKEDLVIYNKSHNLHIAKPPNCLEPLIQIKVFPFWGLLKKIV